MLVTQGQYRGNGIGYVKGFGFGVYLFFGGLTYTSGLPTATSVCIAQCSVFNIQYSV